MDARIKEDQENKFKPFTLEIDVKSFDELNYLCAALNTPPRAVEQRDYSFDPKNIVSQYKVWDILDDKLTELKERN